MLSNNETTARLICEGLKNLLKTKNLDRIRIKEITDEVGLMRPTFYNYFQDKYEVVEYIFTHEVLEPMRPFLQSGLVKEAFHFMIVAIQKDSEFYRREIMRSSQNSFRDILAGSMHDFLLPIIEEKVPKPKHPFLTAENITEYYINIFLFVLTKWLIESPEIPWIRSWKFTNCSFPILWAIFSPGKNHLFPHAVLFYKRLKKRKVSLFGLCHLSL